MRAAGRQPPPPAPPGPPPLPRRAVAAAGLAALLLRPLPLLADEAAAVQEAAAAPPPLPPQSPAALPALVDDASAFEGGVAALLPPGAPLSLTERQILDTNRRVHAANGAPDDFPAFVRSGFDVKVVPSSDGAASSPSPPYTVTDAGLIYVDLAPGAGDPPVDGQEVSFDYTAYNESGARIDSSYTKGRPATVRLGIGGLIPGFELGLRSMRPGGVRRLIVPPALGPPVGPQTFFSAKQCEVFDVVLRSVKSCRRESVAGFSSRVVCE